VAGPVGVVAIQGDFERHLAAVEACGARGVRVREPHDLDAVDRLIIPGGESTTVGKLMQAFGLGEAIRGAAARGMPIWGTCMGMILMAASVEGPPQYLLRLLDITVRRNAFGAQVHSFEDFVEIGFMDTSLMAVFIRAPIVTRVGSGVETIATYQGRVVAVRCGVLVGTSFHPELTEDRRFHQWFLGLPHTQK
jgi:5'-phosphate synthase pdxT subunit